MEKYKGDGSQWINGLLSSMTISERRSWLFDSDWDWKKIFSVSENWLIRLSFLVLAPNPNRPTQTLEQHRILHSSEQLSMIPIRLATTAMISNAFIKYCTTIMIFHHKNHQVESRSLKPSLEYSVVGLAGVVSFAKFSVVSDIIEREGLLILYPLAALSIYLGVVSGWIPTPLYDGNEKWPRQYAILQLVFVVLTALRLTSPTHSIGRTRYDDDGNWMYKNNLEELFEFSRLDGDSLHEYFVHEDGKQLFSQKILPKLILFALASAAAQVVNRFHFLRRIDHTDLPITTVFLRNLFLLICVYLWIISNSILSPGNIAFCEKMYNVTPGFIAPDLPFSQITYEFTTAWKLFHPSHMHWVRLSHSVLYPSILLLLTRRRFTHLILWGVFVGSHFALLIADMFHYVADPQMADERLDFQHEADSACFVNVKLARELLAYPVNFVSLTTSFGDTPSVTSWSLKTNEITVWFAVKIQRIFSIASKLFIDISKNR